MSPRHIPNLISVCRILLVYPVIHLMLAGRFDWALGLFVVAGVSDAVDGFLAKHFHWQSRLGSYLDPVADKLLLISSYLALGWLDLVPFWLAGLVVLRDVVIFGGAVAYYFLLKPFEGQPLLISKLNTLCQLLLVFAVGQARDGAFPRRHHGPFDRPGHGHDPGQRRAVCLHLGQQLLP